METTSNKKTENLSLSNLGDMKVLAQDIKKFITENKLSTNVQGKEFPQAEAWQYAGNRLGIIPQAGELINLSSQDEIKYQASILLIDINNGFKTVGKGFAICSNREQGKKYYQEFAIASMAQTRSIGKAYRIMLSFLMRLAGYEPTPAEEMDYTGNAPEIKVEQHPVEEQQVSGMELTNAIIDLKSSENREQALEAYNKYPQYKNDPDFLAAVKTMSEKYPKTTTT